MFREWGRSLGEEAKVVAGVDLKVVAGVESEVVAGVESKVVAGVESKVVAGVERFCGSGRRDSLDKEPFRERDRSLVEETIVVMCADRCCGSGRRDSLDREVFLDLGDCGRSFGGEAGLAVGRRSAKGRETCLVGEDADSVFLIISSMAPNIGLESQEVLTTIDEADSGEWSEYFTLHSDIGDII